MRSKDQIKLESLYEAISNNIDQTPDEEVNDNLPDQRNQVDGRNTAFKISGTGKKSAKTEEEQESPEELAQKIVDEGDMPPLEVEAQALIGEPIKPEDGLTRGQIEKLLRLIRSGK
jgi:hypothetical protein